MTTYQDHDASGSAISATQHKLDRLQLPDRLDSKRVLDIGCNEGYFSALAHDRGAREVIGIDFVGSNIEFAKQRYARPGVTFLHQGWSKLPDGPFDLVLWTSAMHYELDPAAVAKAVHERLSPDGLFVVECGVVNTPGREFVPVPRIADSRWYPSLEYLETRILAGFSVRKVAQAEIANGDYVPRSVFHCRKSRPTVILIRGNSGDGKTTAASRLRASASKLVALDMLVSRLGVSKHPHGKLEEFLIAQYNPRDLGSLYRAIDTAELTLDYAKLLASAVAATDELVLFEGFMSDAQCAALAQELKSRAVVWDMRRTVS
jgi:SAM-dependent methyltransferase